MLQELALQVMEVYRVLDDEVAGFAARTGLHCPSGCGACCSSERVEATVLECLPLAFELFRTCRAELIFKRLQKEGGQKRCILYRPDFSATGRWGCTQYPQRALVCRLFGFAGTRSRDGLLQLAMCRIMKQKCQAPPAPETTGPMPVFAEAGMRLTALSPSLGTLRLPINQALLEALDKVGMLLDLQGAAPGSSALQPELPPEKPLHPHVPKRRRAF